jgi:cell division protein FtsB
MDYAIIYNHDNQIIDYFVRKNDVWEQDNINNQPITDELACILRETCNYKKNECISTKQESKEIMASSIKKISDEFDKKYTYKKKLNNMNWKHTLIIVVSILMIGMGLGYLISYNAKETRSLQQQIIDAERKSIDSLHKELTTMKTEREKMESQLEQLTIGIRLSESNLSTKINQLKIQNNVKIDAITSSTNDELLDGLRARFNKK